MKIFKYELAIKDNQVIKMPEGAKVLTAQEQLNYSLFVWALVNPDAPQEDRTFEVIGIGNDIEPNRNRSFISTVQMGGYVWHVFEILKNS